MTAYYVWNSKNPKKYEPTCQKFMVIIDIDHIYMHSFKQILVLNQPKHNSQANTLSSIENSGEDMHYS